MGTSWQWNDYYTECHFVSTCQILCDSNSVSQMISIGAFLPCSILGMLGTPERPWWSILHHPKTIGVFPPCSSFWLLHRQKYNSKYDKSIWMLTIIAYFILLISWLKMFVQLSQFVLLWPTPLQIVNSVF